MRKYFPILSIAGSDSSGGAGIQADIKTISAIGGYAMTAITAITAQNTQGVYGIMPVDAAIVKSQILSVCRDIPPVAIKIGMLCSEEIVIAVAECLEQLRHDGHLPPVVFDPVMVSTSGADLMSVSAIAAAIDRIFKLSAIVTPNVQEAIRLTGSTDPARQGECLRQLGCQNILLKGGDTESTLVKRDLLLLDGEDDFITLQADCINTPNTHGTGCTLSSAIATYLGLGFSMLDAVAKAKIYVTRAIEAGQFVTTGQGHGPLNHFFSPRRLKNYNPNTYGNKN